MHHPNTYVPVLQDHPVPVRILAFAVGGPPRLTHLPADAAVGAVGGGNRRRPCRIPVAGGEADTWWIEIKRKL